MNINVSANTMCVKDHKGITVRMPIELHAGLTKRRSQIELNTGRRITINELIIIAIEKLLTDANDMAQ